VRHNFLKTNIFCPKSSIFIPLKLSCPLVEYNDSKSFFFELHEMNEGHPRMLRKKILFVLLWQMWLMYLFGASCMRFWINLCKNRKETKTYKNEDLLSKFFTGHNLSWLKSSKLTFTSPPWLSQRTSMWKKSDKQAKDTKGIPIICMEFCSNCFLEMKLLTNIGFWRDS